MRNNKGKKSSGVIEIKNKIIERLCKKDKGRMCGNTQSRWYERGNDRKREWRKRERMRESFDCRATKTCNEGLEVQALHGVLPLGKRN